ncbi:MULTISPECIES: LLM class flavin-dependent oxidoreductase [Mycobacterium]|uniref:LLM class flavin-dependent oxidoreductase n=1 Tax=Mycobacterium TaxID=1763 RepID=UPI001EF020CA|nr:MULTISPECIES: LLM class flavin-dependent oxidoreductase [Mycobacterium]
MRFSIAIPQLGTDDFDTTGLRDYLVRAEELGFEGGWTLEQAIGESALLAPLEVLAFAAACTRRMRLGVAVMVTSLHDPLQLAAAVTAVDRLSNGRLDLGVVAGGGSRKFGAFGVEKATHVSYFTEGLELMRAAWSDQPRITFHGRFRELDDLPIQPKPVQRPHPPIWFGGHAPAALARAVRLGDAFIGAGSATTEAFADAVAIVRRELDAQHKDPAGFTIAKRVYVVVDDDTERARERALAGLRRIYGERPDLDTVAVAGNAARVAGELSRVMYAGAQMLLLNPLGANVAQDREQMERLALEVISRLG